MTSSAILLNRPRLARTDTSTTSTRLTLHSFRPLLAPSTPTPARTLPETLLSLMFFHDRLTFLACLSSSCPHENSPCCVLVKASKPLLLVWRVRQVAIHEPPCSSLVFTATPRSSAREPALAWTWQGGRL